MCGITGILEIGGKRASVRDAAAMTRQVMHRGPDGQGIHLMGPVALGNRRLSIIDLVSGGQPMQGRDGQVWITYNGELYNFQELRKELNATGHIFRTSSDTEVVLH